MTRIEVKPTQRRCAHQWRAIRRHGAQSSPELCLRQITTRKKFTRDLLERGTAAWVQTQIKASQLGHAPDTQTITEAGQCNLVGLVQHGGLGCERGIAQWHGE